MKRTPAPGIEPGFHPQPGAEELVKDCGEFFDASESISDCLARQRLNL